MQGKFCIFHFGFLVIIDLANEKLGLLINKKKDILIIKKRRRRVGIPYFSISTRGGDEIFSSTPLSLASTCGFITSSSTLMVISFSFSFFSSL